MVEHRRVIASEIAKQYGRALATVQDVWRKHPDWPAAVGKRGRWKEYDAQAIDALVRRAFLREPLMSEGSPDDLLTIGDIVTYTGLARGTVDFDISQGRIPEPDKVEDGVKRWRRSTIDEALKGRRAYRRVPAERRAQQA